MHLRMETVRTNFLYLKKPFASRALVSSSKQEESEDDDAECLILKDVRDEESGESVYEIVENEKELQAVSKVFEELLEDVSIEL